MNKELDYQSAGVDIQAGNQLVKNIKPIVSKTHGPQVLSSLGGFAGLFELGAQNYKNPVLVSGTDGVGTKLKLALECNKHDTIGIDLVAMCVNDILVCGATPLFFLDYFATSKLKVDVATDVVSGIAKGCEIASMALIGGETAEMPGMYQQDDYDLAGFCVGVVDKENIINAEKVKTGDVLLGLASSGPHSNGYSLIRKILEVGEHRLDTELDGKTLADLLLEPTKIYSRVIQKLLKQHDVHAFAHITGGGLIENLPRVIPEGLKASIDTQAWQWPSIFTWLQQQGDVNTREMYRTFNCGIGMVICVDATEADACMQLLNEQNETVYRIGQIKKQSAGDSQQLELLG